MMVSSRPQEQDADPPSILVVDDNANNLSVLSDYLQKCRYRVLVARSGDIALKRLEHVLPDVILLDVMMPGIDGYETCRRIKQDPRLRDIPVIFMTALASEEHKVAGFLAGGVDYIAKPLQHEELIARVSIHLRMSALNRRLQQQNQRMAKLAAIQVICSDISQEFTRMLDSSSLLDSVCRVIQSSFDDYFVGMWLVSEHDGSIRLCAATMRQGAIDRANACVISCDDPQSIVAWVCASNRAYMTNDTAGDSRYRTSRICPDTRAELVLPLMANGRLIGALDIQRDRLAAFDGDEEVVILHALANQVATAMGNARLYEQVLHMKEDLERVVTERTQELRGAYHDLEHLDEAKMTFIQIASHELLTPMNGVMGCLTLLADSPLFVGAAEDRLFIDGALEGAHQMVKVINIMRRVSEIDSHSLLPSFRAVELGGLVRGLCARYEPSRHERAIALTWHGIDDLPVITADAGLLDEALAQLLVNAIKYTPDGGRIEVRGQVPTDEPDAVEIIVEDTGIGIDPSHFRVIFGKFYQTGKADFHSSGATKFKGGGPGLGLPLAKGIVEAHGGRIWAESDGHDEAGCPGSRFYVRLPVAGPPRP